MIVGIDLGTSTSELAYFRNGKAELLREVAGANAGILPSVVGLTSRGRLDVGDAMVSQREHRPTMVVEEVKRKMGSGATVKIGDDEYRPQEVSAMILRRLKESAERFFGHPIDEAIITVPANFNDNQRRATLEAGELAGLRVRRLINEPTAAALAYGLDRPGVEERVLVYDLGGGTLDVTVLELSEGILDVLSSVGIPQLGGKDFDTRLMTHLARECRRSTGIDLTDAQGRTKLNAAARRAKISLSTQESCDVIIEHIGLGPEGPITFEYEMSRVEFESLIVDLVQSSCEAIHEALDAKGLTPEDIDTILMVGGSTRIPLVRRVVSDVFGGRTLRTDINPDEAVSLGAAILGGIEAGTVSSEQTVITDVAPHTFGIAIVMEADEEDIHDAFSPIINKHSTIPRTERRSYRTMHDFQEFVKIRVFQGEEPLCSNNLFICEFPHPMAPAPAGAEVLVEFSYDLSSNLHLAAIDVATGQRTDFRWHLASGLNSSEEKEAAAARIDAQWSSPVAGAGGAGHGNTRSRSAETTSEREWERSPLWPSVSALYAHATKRMTALGPAEQSKVLDLLRTLETCAVNGDGNGLEAAEDTLTQLLFDLE